MSPTAFAVAVVIGLGLLAMILGSAGVELMGVAVILVAVVFAVISRRN